jgi:cysteine desulfurase/selenocysteine lyase
VKGASPLDFDWDALRAAEFPVAERWAYFDHAAVAPLPRRSARAIQAWAEDQSSRGCVRWGEWEQRTRETRRDVARLINSHPDEIAFVNSTTQGIGLVAEGFPWHEGDSVVTALEEYPSNLYPWMNLATRGVTTRLVPSRNGRVEADDLFAAMDETTRLLTISHVEFASGFRNDLDDLAARCHERGVAFFVDAIQGLGPFVYDVARTPIDFLAADGHKWLLGPEGAGFLYVRKDWFDRLRTLGVGSRSVVGSYNSPEPEFTLKPTGERWEGGAYNMPGLQGFGESVKIFLEAGPANVSNRILDRAEAVREIARSTGWTIYGSSRPADLSGIVSLQKPGADSDLLVRRMRDGGVVASCRRGRLRISPHVYNNHEDMLRLREYLSS